MKTIEELEEELFREWKKTDTGRFKDNFFHDGVPTPERYLQTTIRTIFVLREANFDGVRKDYHLRSELTTSPHPFWKGKIAPWCFGLADLDSSPNELWLQAMSIKNNTAQCIDLLNQFGYIQIKKAPGRATSIPRELAEAARLDGDLIRRQLAIYQPTVIVACGVSRPTTFDLLARHVFPGSLVRCRDQYKHRCAKVEDGHSERPPMFLIETLHPSHRKSREKVFKELIADFRQVVNEFNLPQQIRE